MPVNSLQKSKFWTCLNSKHWQKTKINVTENLKTVLGRVENFGGKRENDGYQHFLFFPKCFQKASFFEVVKIQDCVGGVNTMTSVCVNVYNLTSAG